MITVHTAPTGTYSRAMTRTATALTRGLHSGYMGCGCAAGAPPCGCGADIVVLHAIGRDYMDIAAQCRANGQRYIIIQYCLLTSGATAAEWADTWRGAELVWSYYDLRAEAKRYGFRFYHSPLGVDGVFWSSPSNIARERLIITTGYVHGPAAEAIEEVWLAARRCGVESVHVGPPHVDGTKLHADRHCQPDDGGLAVLYRRATWVAGLRHVEGFELPAAEALACGACPLLFSQPTTRRWYNDFALFLNDSDGDVLQANIETRLYHPPVVLTDELWRQVKLRFDWITIVDGLWSILDTQLRAAS